MIQEYAEGYHFSNADALFKENYNKRNVAADIIGIWNALVEKDQLLLQNYSNVCDRDFNQQQQFYIQLLSSEHQPDDPAAEEMGTARL